MDYQVLPWPWYYRQLSCTRKMLDVLLKKMKPTKPTQHKQELLTARVFLLLDPLQSLQRHQQAGQTNQYNHRSYHSCWVWGTIAYAKWELPQKWGQGWKQGQTAITAFIPHFSLAAENWQSQLFLFTLSCGVAYAAKQTGASFAFLLVPVRIWSTVLG